MFNHFILLLIIIYYSCINLVSSTIASIDLDSSFTDDYESDPSNAGLDGWSLRRQNPNSNEYEFSLVNDNNNNTIYHGWYNIPDTSYFYRYFDIASYGYIQITFTYFWACDIEEKGDGDGYGDWMLLEFGNDNLHQFSWTDDIPQVSEDKLGLFNDCSGGGLLEAWEETFTFTSNSIVSNSLIFILFSFLFIGSND